MTVTKGLRLAICVLLTWGLLLARLVRAQEGPKGPDTTESDDDAISPKERCNQFLAFRDVWDKGIAEAANAINQSLIAKHSTFWATGMQHTDSEGTQHLTQSQEAALTEDLNKLLDIVWQIEMSVVRRLYVSPEHARPFPHLKVKLDSDSEMGAWACLDKTTMQISPTLIRNMWINSVNEQISSRIELDIKSQDQLLEAIRLTKPPKVTYQDFVHDTENAIRGADYNRLKLAAYGMAKFASIEYVKALLFLLSHEAAHHWLDHCPPYGVTIYSETRADDYGLLVSSSWLGEQFNQAQLEADSANLRRTLINQAREERKAAVARLKANSYEAEPSFTLSPDKFSDQQIASESDAAITRRIERDLPSKSEMPFSLGRQGFQTFVDVYEKAGLKEYLEGNSTHPSVAVRLKRLEHGYASENLKGRDILLGRLGTERAIQRLVHKRGKERADREVLQ
jgi:hypothetical protein